jgi:putative ABC transport system permease protein
MLKQDIRYGFRMLIKKPGFTIVAILTLALGIGANTAIFSVVNSILLKPLPFNNSDRIVAMSGTTSTGQTWISYPNLEDYRRQNNVFEEISALTPQSVNLTGMETPDRVRGGFVSSGFFKVFDVQPSMGRVFQPEEDQIGSQRVTVVNHNVWKSRFGSDPNLIGKSLILNGEPFTVVGIMPPDFQIPIDEIEVWIPAQYYPNYKPVRSAHNYFAIGRLKPGVELSKAQAEMDTIANRLAQAYPEDNKGIGIKLTQLQEMIVSDIRPALLVLLAAVGFILLIACANIANLLLARGAARNREVAIRAALGASRVRLLTQLLTETTILGLLGGCLGLLIALWGVDILVSLNPQNLPSGLKIAPDIRVLCFTLLLSIFTGLLFGLFPALQLSKPDLLRSLKEGGRGSGEVTGQKLRSAFVISQVALSLVLLIGAGLLIKSFYRLLTVDPGFKSENLLTMEYRLPINKYSKPEQQNEFHRQVVEKIRVVPGVRSAALVLGLPFSGNGGARIFTLPDRELPEKDKEPRALFNTATPGYFETIGIPLLKGRSFTDQDGPDSAKVILINQSMASQYWPNDDPIGKQVHLPQNNITVSVIGVVGNAKQFGLSEELRPQIYACYTQNPNIFATIVARTDVEPMSLAESVKKAVWSVDKDQPMWKIRTVDYLLERNVASERFVVMLMSVFAALALILTSLGIYGVISYSVTQRTQEIGVRMALGALERDVLKLVISQAAFLALIGVVIGLAASFALTRLMSSLLFGVSPTDPVTFAGITMLLFAVAMLACYLPARRATKVDPMVALRYE